MKNLLDWKTQSVANIYDEANLWSAPFGKLLLDNIPMKLNAHVLDIGFGTGFPLIELSQRFGEHAQIFGVDIWEAGINKTTERIRVLGLKNIQIFNTSATTIDLPDASIDLVTSNLGINNFDEKEKVYLEIHRLLKSDGHLCLTTNTIGTFDRFFQLFKATLIELSITESLEKLEGYLKHRSKKTTLIQEIENHGFTCIKSVEDSAKIRFADATAIFNHSLIRIGFRAYWESLVPTSDHSIFFDTLVKKIEEIIEKEGSFDLEIPVLFLSFKK